MCLPAQVYCMFMLKQYETFTDVSTARVPACSSRHIACTCIMTCIKVNSFDFLTRIGPATLLQMWSWKLVVGAGAANAVDKPRISVNA